MSKGGLRIVGLLQRPFLWFVADKILSKKGSSRFTDHGPTTDQRIVFFDPPWKNLFTCKLVPTFLSLPKFLAGYVTFSSHTIKVRNERNMILYFFSF